MKQTAKGTFFSLALIVIAGCAASRAGTSGDQLSPTREIIVREMRYDEKGLPVPGQILTERPSRPGDHFTVVSLAENRPLVSYDIAVVRGKPDFSKPVQAVYEWTGKGFKVGLEASGVLAQGLQAGTYSDNTAVAALVFVLTPMTAGTVGGFIIGVVDGIRQTALELGKFVLRESDQVLTCTLYDYDLRGRLVVMRMLSPDRKQELVRTEFIYEGFASEPVRTVINSRAEGKERDIR